MLGVWFINHINQCSWATPTKISKGLQHVILNGIDTIIGIKKTKTLCSKRND